MATSKLPANPDAERFILGSVILDSDLYPVAAQALSMEDFSLQDLRSIFTAMGALQAQGITIDRLTIFDELQRQSTPLSLTYLASLDEGLPATPNIGAYVNIVKEKSRLRKLIRHSRELYTAAVSPDALSSEVIAKGQANLLEVGNTLDERGQMLSDYVAGFPGGPNIMLDPAKWEKGIPTGFTILDEWTDGFHESEIFLIGARPGVGKSSIGLNIARFLAANQNLVAFFSMEMSKQICLNRLICERAGVSFQRFRRGTLQDEERRWLLPAMGYVSELPIFIDESSGLTVADISMRLQSIAKDKPVALCVIDYVQLLRAPKGKRYSTENEKFEEIANDLQRMSKQSKIPLLLLSQLTRESEKATGDKRPTLSQCRGSGGWEQIANVGITLFREEMSRKGRPDLRGKCECIVAKNRSGPTGTIMLRYAAQMMQFSDPSEDADVEPSEGEN